MAIFSAEVDDGRGMCIASWLGMPPALRVSPSWRSCLAMASDECDSRKSAQYEPLAEEGASRLATDGVDISYV